MLRLTTLLGVEVLQAGRPVGSLWDVQVSREGQHPRVEALWVRRGRGEPVGVPCTAGVEVDGAVRVTGEVRAASDRPATGKGVTLPPEPTGLLLRKHVLDSQVVDLVGKRLARVGDIVLADRGGELKLAGIEIGARPVLRRLGLGRLARGARSEEIDWADVHLASAPGHSLHLDMPRAAIHSLSDEELAALVEALPPTRAEEVVRATSATARAQPPKPARRSRGKRFGDIMRARRRAPR